MLCEEHLALTAILTGLRRTGAIDKRAIQGVIEALQETAAKAQADCPDKARGLLSLAGALQEGPVRSCRVHVAA